MSDNEETVANGEEVTSVKTTVDVTAKLTKPFLSKLKRWVLEIEEADETLGLDPTVEDCENIRENLQDAMYELKGNTTNPEAEEQVRKARADFTRARLYLNAVIKRLKTPPPPPAFTPSTSKMDNFSLHLRKLDIPKCPPSSRGYPKFKKDFSQIVETKLTDDMALYRLKNDALIKGSIEHSIVSSKSTLNDAWRALDKILGRPGAIKDAIIKDVNDIPAIADVSDGPGLRKMVAELISARDELKEQNFENALGENALSALMLKIPFEIRSEIDAKIYDDDLDVKQSMDIFIEKCERYAMINEVHQLRTEAYGQGAKPKTRLASALVQKSQPVPPPSEYEEMASNYGDEYYEYEESDPQTLAQTFSNPKKQTRQSQNPERYTPQPKPGMQAKPPRAKSCILHPEASSHDTCECKQFILTKTPQDQKKILEKSQACQRCFLTNHPTEKCRSGIKCAMTDCKSPKSHATIIHSACLATVMITDASVVTKPPESECERRELAQFLGASTIRPSHHAFLKTKNGRVKISLLYDNGATLSQITNDVAQSSGIEPVNTLKNLLMSTAGNPESQEWGKSCLYKIPLYDEAGNLVTILKCVGVKFIGTLDNGTYEKVASIFENDGLKPKELLQPVSGEIQVLVGNNHASLFPSPIKTIGEVVWAETHFGNILHGSHHDFPKRQEIPKTDLTQAILEASAQCLTVTAYQQAYYGIAQCFMEMPPSKCKRTDASVNSQKHENTPRIETCENSRNHESDQRIHTGEKPQKHESDQSVDTREKPQKHESVLHINTDVSQKCDPRTLTGKKPQKHESGESILTGEKPQNHKTGKWIGIGEKSLQHKRGKRPRTYRKPQKRRTGNGEEPTERETPGIEKVKCRCCHLYIVKAVEETVFDRLTEIEDQPICFRCQQCRPGPSHMKKDDERRMAIYRNCLYYDPKRRCFFTKMPWRKSFKILPDNKDSSLKRLFALTKSMAKDPNMRDWYKVEFQKIIDKGVLVLVTDEEAEQWAAIGGKVWYVNHFGVLNECSESTPLRIVFDPTAKYKGILLDSLWVDPPNLTPPIPKLTLQWREKKVPVSMDVSKAYWSLLLEEIESHLHRVLWNELDEDAKVKTYRMLRNSWGMKPAGALCSIAMQILAENNKEEYPHVYDFIMNSLYVDDGTTSVDSVEIAKKLARDVSKVLESGSFFVKHFIIGGKEFVVTEDDDLPDHVRCGREQERVLGVIWHPQTDEISVNARINLSKKKRGAHVKPDVEEHEFDEQFTEITQRLYLSLISTPFDPDGLASPVTILQKSELGRIFELKLGWDVPIPDSPSDDTTNKLRCKELVRTLFGLKNIRFNRLLRPEDAIEENPVLVVYTDSSQMAYACVAFYSWLCANGKRKSCLVKAKARPIPKNGPILYRIPRAELMGVVLGSRMAKFIVQSSSYTFTRIFMITDSTIVLGQLMHEPCRFDTWVANRIDEVQQITNIDDWYFTRSENNIADIATRGALPEDIGKDSRWQNGAEFMVENVEDWDIIPCRDVHSKSKPKTYDMEFRIKDPRMEFPKPRPQVQLPNIDSESEKQMSSETVLLQSVSTNQDELDNITLQTLERLNFIIDPNDSWSKCRRRIARIIRFLETGFSTRKNSIILPVNFSKWSLTDRNIWINSNDKFSPSKREMTLAARFLVKLAQKLLPTNIQRTLSSLNPKCDENGLWRAVGRTSQAVNSPLIIPNEHPLAPLLLRHFHMPSHPGADTTLSLLRREFWIINGRRTANKFVSDCCFCKWLKKQIYEVEMAPLRIDQCTEHPVFSNVAIDIAGPYLTKAERRPTRSYNVMAGKIWVLVLMCKSSRACHLETMEGYDTANFLAAFDAFIQLRGKPKSVVADMGSQITSASGTLESLWSHVDPVKLRNHLPGEIEWDFVPSGAHHFLGCAERMVQCFKKTMEAVCFSRSPEHTKLAFQRLLYAIANIINDRPLAVGRINTTKLDADRLIRPNDLLLGRSSSDITPLIDFDAVSNLSSERRQYIQLLAVKDAFINAFWSKWYEQVFNVLLPRSKWHRTDRQIRPEDIVIIRDTNPVRNRWSWGEVSDVHYSADGFIRKCTIRYKNLTDKADRKSDIYTPSKSKFVLKCTRDVVVILPAEQRTKDD